MNRALLCALCVSCGPDPVPLERFGTEAQDALCDWAVRCRHVPDEGTCLRLLDPKQYDVRRALDAVAAGRIVYDAGEAGRCLAAARDAACLAAPFGDPACARLFDGQVPEGGACTSSFECVEGGLCALTTCGVQCCLGTCGPPQPPPQPPELAEVGEACDTHSDCVPTAYCELDRRCAPLPDEVGEHCLAGCAYGDLYCDLATETCRAYTPLGGMCTIAFPCDPAYAYCEVFICRPRPGAGEPCDLAPCIASTTCEAGTCRARGTVGDLCLSDEQCQVVCDESMGRCADYETCTTP